MFYGPDGNRRRDILTFTHPTDTRMEYSFAFKLHKTAPTTRFYNVVVSYTIENKMAARRKLAFLAWTSSRILLAAKNTIIKTPRTKWSIEHQKF